MLSAHPGAQRDHVALAGVSDGVLGELQQRLCDPLLVEQCEELGRVVDDPLACTQGTALLQDRHQEGCEVDRTESEEVQAVGLGEHAQVVHQP